MLAHEHEMDDYEPDDEEGQGLEEGYDLLKPFEPDWNVRSKE